MNIIMLTRGGQAVGLSNQFARIAPPNSLYCVIEVDQDDEWTQFANKVANMIAADESANVSAFRVQGYQIGAAPDDRERFYHVWFVHKNGTK